jgi:hypothetical protein
MWTRAGEFTSLGNHRQNSFGAKILASVQNFRLTEPDFYEKTFYHFGDPVKL